MTNSSCSTWRLLRPWPTHSFRHGAGWCMVHFEKKPPDCLLRMETFGGRILQKTLPGANEDNRKIAFLFSAYEGVPPPDTSRSDVGREPSQLAGRGEDSQEFTLSVREPGPVNEKIPYDFLKQCDIELLDVFVRCTGYQWRHRAGSIWCEDWKSLRRTSPTTRKKRCKQRIFAIREPSFSSNASSGDKARRKKMMFFTRRTVIDKSQAARQHVCTVEGLRLRQSVAR